MTDNDASIPVAGRFQRIENALDRIEAKLDSKVGLREFSELELRVGTLETGSSPYQRPLIEQLKQTVIDVSSLKLEGSKSAREALAEAKALDLRVIALEAKTLTSDAVQKALETSQSNASKLKWAIIGIVLSSILSAAGIVIPLILNH